MADCICSCEVTPLTSSPVHPQNCCFCYGPFGYTHRHTCAWPLYTKWMSAVQIWIHTVAHTRQHPSTHAEPYSSLSPLFCWRHICIPDVRCTLRCCWAQDVLHSLCGTCEAFLWAVRLAALACVSWGSVCLGLLLAGSRGFGTTVSMLIQGRCGVLNQVVRGNSGPGRRETLAALCGGPTLHKKFCSCIRHIWCGELYDMMYCICPVNELSAHILSAGDLSSDQTVHQGPPCNILWSCEK